MSEKYITIQEAADLAHKSVQTIRRSIKAKKIKVRRKKTPQGFNYLVNKQSVVDAFNLDRYKDTPSEIVSETATETTNAVAVKGDVTDRIEAQYSQMQEVFGQFNKTVQSLVEQSNKDRENYFRLMQTFQDRVVLMENQVKLLEETANQKSWYQFWK